MSRPFNGHTRPGLLTHRSYHDYGETKKHNTAGETHPYPKYEMYDITPRESPFDENRGRWFRANTKRISTPERELEQFVREQWASNYKIVDALLDRKMQGSKREHIHEFIASKDTANPEWEHQLVFIKLNRNHKQKDSKKSKQKTLSMHIILERKLHPHDNIGLPLPRPTSSQGPIGATGGLPATNHVQDRSMLGTGTAPINMPRPQYHPSYAKAREPDWQNNSLRVQVSGNRDVSDRLFAPPTPRITTCDSDGSASFSPASPSSTLSSDTARSSSQRASYSSSPNDAAFIAVPKNKGHDAQGGHHLALARDTHRSYVDVGTQTDMDWNAYAHGLTQLITTKLREEPTERAENDNSCADAHAPYTTSSKGGNTSSTGEQSDEQETPKLGTAQEATNIGFEKPAWMNNMQPGEVHTPTVTDENVDTFANPVDKQPIARDGVSKVGKAATKELPSPHKEMNIRPECGIGNTDPAGHMSIPIREITSPIMTPRTISGYVAGNVAPVRKDITISEYLSGISEAVRPNEGYFPPPGPLPIPQAQSRRHSDDASPRQSERKSVRFDLSAQPSTVPSTPIMGTPPYSPDTTTSSSSSECAWTPKAPAGPPHANPPRRPQLQRSSHSSSLYPRSPNPHLPHQPRSSSYRELPPSHPDNEEKDWWSTVPANANRRQPPSAQNPNPVRRLYECKIDRCRSSGFESRDELNQHMSSVHNMKQRGSM